jgi:hypothetical protein
MINLFKKQVEYVKENNQIPVGGGISSHETSQIIFYETKPNTAEYPLDFLTFKIASAPNNLLIRLVFPFTDF